MRVDDNSHKSQLLSTLILVWPGLYFCIPIVSVVTRFIALCSIIFRYSEVDKTVDMVDLGSICHRGDNKRLNHGCMDRAQCVFY